MAKFGHFLSLKILWFGQNQHFFVTNFPHSTTQKKGAETPTKDFFISKNLN